MKGLAVASIAVLTLLAGSAHAAPKDVWTQIDGTVSKSIFEQLNETAPHSNPFKGLQDTAQRSDGVFGILEKNAP